MTTPASTNNEPALRACTISGCKANKYVEVTKRKCSQFVASPYIIPKPLVVNGKTSIFQVGGEMAKMGDIPTLSAQSGGDGSGKPIYRIKPGTHAHIINYVLVDEGSQSLEKANSGDQQASRMLLDAQRQTATSKLQRLIGSHRGTAATVAASTSTPAATPAGVNVARRPATAAAATSTGRGLVSTPQIHPNFSIASVEGAVPFMPPLTPANASPAVADAGNSSTATVSKLQAEIQELRRTVARLEKETLR